MGSSGRPRTAAAASQLLGDTIGRWREEEAAAESACLMQRTCSVSSGHCPENSPQRISLCSIRNKLNITCPKAGKLPCPSGRREKARTWRKIPSLTNAMKSRKTNETLTLVTGHLLCAKHFSRFTCVMFHICMCDYSLSMKG